MTSTDNLRALIRDIPDFPKPGIMFRDIVPLLGDGEALNQTAQLIANRAIANNATAIVGIEARGFLFGCAAAAIAKIPFVPLRKPGKLPGETISAEYALEYGTDRLEAPKDSIKPGAKVALVDDLIATGGTAEAGAKLIRDLGGVPEVGIFVIELDGLGGREALEATGVKVEALLTYDE